jgi:hypothetical protein
MSNITSWSGVAQASGSQMHNVVYNVGRFFGHKFKPWEAVNTAAKIGKFGKFAVPAITAGISIGMEIHQARAEDKRRKEIRAAKDQFEADIRNRIKNIRRQLENEVRVSILSNYDNKLNEINLLKMELSKTIKQNQVIQDKIKELSALYENFIEQINCNDSVDDQEAIVI